MGVTICDNFTLPGLGDGVRAAAIANFFLRNFAKTTSYYRMAADLILVNL